MSVDEELQTKDLKYGSTPLIIFSRVHRVGILQQPDSSQGNKALESCPLL